jgi:acetate kinase
MSDTVLVLNAGSSSVKFQLFAAGPYDTLDRRLKGIVEGIGTTHPRFEAKGLADLDESPAAAELATVPQAIQRLMAFLDRVLGGTRPAAVGHRVVHGGARHAAPEIVGPALLAELEALVPLAPLHQPNNLLPIRVLAERDPSLAQVACFDTAFHRGRPELADRFALPEDLHARGTRRYGFHGLSYEWIARRMREVAPGDAHRKVVVAHLGSGASLCAIEDGRAVDSTMGFTALDGLPMGTRTGSLDPGVVLHLLAEGMSPKEIETLLYKRSGLLGVSGLSSDVRDLLASDLPAAHTALDLFVHRIVREVGALAAAMGGLDALVFTAGIGEHSPTIRARVCDRLLWLGLEIDHDANARGERLISSPYARVAAYVVPTDEERMIASHCQDLLRRHAALPAVA